MNVFDVIMTAGLAMFFFFFYLKCLFVWPVFAYGATGAGKTHTMLGTSDAPGVMFLTMKELFARMDLIKEDKVFNIAFSYLEVRF